MGLFSGIAKAAKAVFNNPIVKPIAKSVPGVATAYTAFDVGTKIFGGGGGGGAPSLPALPPGPNGAGLPGTPGAHPSMGNRSIFRNDPNIIAALKPFAIPMRDLRQYYRAPKGFVVLYDQAGDPFGIPKQMAKAYGLWKPAAKPPISATDWKSFKRAASVGKKLKRIDSMAQKYLTKRSSTSSRKRSPNNVTYIVEDGPGSVKTKSTRVR